MDVVAETGQSLAFRDIKPQAPTHVLVVPRRHVATSPAPPRHTAEELADVVRAGGVGGRRGGPRRATASSPTRVSAAGQSVFHAHLHVIGGRGLGWPPG